MPGRGVGERDGELIPAQILHFRRDRIAWTDRQAVDDEGGVWVELEPRVIGRLSVLTIGVGADLLDSGVVESVDADPKGGLLVG